MSKLASRALSLMKQIIAKEAEVTAAQKNLAEMQAELASLLPDSPAAKRKARPVVSRTVEAKVPAKSEGNGHESLSGRGDLTEALIKAAKTFTEEFTSRDLIQAAKVPPNQEGSAYSAISRLSNKGTVFAKSDTPGKYRRV